MNESEKKQLTIRIDKSLFEAIEKLAQKESRKINGQIEFILKKYMEIRGE